MLSFVGVLPSFLLAFSVVPQRCVYSVPSGFLSSIFFFAHALYILNVSRDVFSNSIKNSRLQSPFFTSMYAPTPSVPVPTVPVPSARSYGVHISTTQKNPDSFQELRRYTVGEATALLRCTLQMFLLLDTY